MVIWSADGAKSAWVQSEADQARLDGKLVQLRVDAAPLPMPFDRFQCSDLTNWTGDPSAREWERVVAAVAELTSGVAVSALPEALHQAASTKPSVAVMPFANLSRDPDQDYLADGMVEDIVAALGRFRSIYVIAAGGVWSSGASWRLHRKQRASWAWATCWRAACATPAGGCGSPFI